MATALDDLPNQAVLGLTLPPDDYTGSQTGTPIDLAAGDGRGFALFLCGAPPESPVAVRAQTSADGVTWADAALFPTVQAAGVYAVGFDRVAGRFARVALDAPDGVRGAAVVGQQRKQL